MVDIKFLLSVRNVFAFSGLTNDSLVNKHGRPIVQFSRNGVSGLVAFYAYDSLGMVLETKHPNILAALLHTKKSVNLHIRMYAEDRAAGRLPKFELIELCKRLGAPDWFYEAVENQKGKYYMFHVEQSRP